MNSDSGPFRSWRVFVPIIATAGVALATVLAVSILAGVIR